MKSINPTSPFALPSVAKTADGVAQLAVAGPIAASSKDVLLAGRGTSAAAGPPGRVEAIAVTLVSPPRSPLHSPRKGQQNLAGTVATRLAKLWMHEKGIRLLNGTRQTFLLGAQIGEGSFGSVHLGLNVLGRRVVIKIIDLSQEVRQIMTDLRLSQAQKQTQRTELLAEKTVEFAVMNAVQASSRPLDRFEDDDGNLCIVLLELRHDLGMGEQRALLSGAKGALATQVVVHEVARAAENCHARGYLHRDLKLENVMTDEMGNIHLIDYGEARQMRQNEGKSVSLPIDWSTESRPSDLMAPEMRRESFPEEGPAAEVFTLGLVALMALTGKDATVFSSQTVHDIWPEFYRGVPLRADGMLDAVALRAQLMAAHAAAPDKQVSMRQRESLVLLIEEVYCRAPLLGPFIISHLLHPDPARRPSMLQVAEQTQPTAAEFDIVRGGFAVRTACDEERSAYASDLEEAHRRNAAARRSPLGSPLGSPKRRRRSPDGPEVGR